MRSVINRETGPSACPSRFILPSSEAFSLPPPSVPFLVASSSGPLRLRKGWSLLQNGQNLRWSPSWSTRRICAQRMVFPSHSNQCNVIFWVFRSWFPARARVWRRSGTMSNPHTPVVFRWHRIDLDTMLTELSHWQCFPITPLVGNAFPHLH